MPERKLSASLQDYLEAIYEISREKGFAQAQRIADQLGVSKSSVSWALNQLSEKELIHYKPYEAITLTEKGKAAGRRLARRHEEIKGFLTEILGINEQVAEDNACRMEHVIDRKIFDRMRMFMGFMEKCPRVGREWMKGFGYFCEQGERRENCQGCVAECLEEIAQSASAESVSSEAEVPKRSKARDEQLILQQSQATIWSARPSATFLGQKGSAMSWRPMATRSALPSAIIDSAISGVLILPTAITGTLTFLFIASAR